MCRDSPAAKLIVELESQIVGVQRIGKNIYVGCMDDTLRCYSSKVSLANNNCTECSLILEMFTGFNRCYDDGRVG